MVQLAKTLWLLPFIHIHNIPPYREITQLGHPFTQLSHSQLSHPFTQLSHSQLSHPLTQLSHREGFYFCFRYNQVKKIKKNFNLQILLSILRSNETKFIWIFKFWIFKKLFYSKFFSLHVLSSFYYKTCQLSILLQEIISLAKTY